MDDDVEGTLSFVGALDLSNCSVVFLGFRAFGAPFMIFFENAGLHLNNPLTMASFSVAAARCVCGLREGYPLIGMKL